MHDPQTAAASSFDSPPGDPSLSPSAAFAPPPINAPASLPPQRTRWWLVALTIIELLVIIILQRPAPADPAEIAEGKQALTVRAPSSDPHILMGKLLLGFKRSFPGMEEIIRQQIDQPSLGEPDAATQVRIVMLLVGADEVRAKSPADAAAAVPAMTFPGLPAPAPPRDPAKMLDDVVRELAPESPLHADIAALRPLVELAADESSTEVELKDAVAALPDQARADLKQRHGWFADVLLSVGDHTAPVRTAAEAQTMLFLLLVTILGAGVGLAFLAGLVLLVVGLVQVFSGRIRPSFAPPQRIVITSEADAREAWARGLFLETVAVFLAGFLGLKVVHEVAALAIGPRSWMIWSSLGGQWLLLITIFWPVARGLSWDQWKTLMGWRAPRGVAREIGAGFCAYLAALPIYFAMAIIVVILMLIVEAIRAASGMPPGPPPTNRITEIVGSGEAAVLAMVFLLATVWAPIVEESIFRGALYRALRGRFWLLGAGFLSAFVFAAVHGYVAVQLLMVFTLGVVFAVMREWRNSLIPSVTAHAMHNGFAMTVMLVASWFMQA